MRGTEWTSDRFSDAYRSCKDFAARAEDYIWISDLEFRLGVEVGHFRSGVRSGVPSRWDVLNGNKQCWIAF